MEQLNPKALISAFIMSRCLGCFPFTFHGKCHRLNKILLAYSVSIKLIIGLLIVKGIVDIPNIYDRESSLYIVFVTVHLFAEYIVLNCFFIYICTQGRRFLSLFIKFAKADRLFLRLKNQPCDSHKSNFDYFILSMTLIEVIVRYFLKADIFNSVALLYIDWMIFLLVQPFIAVVKNLLERFAALRRMLVSTSDSPSVNYRFVKLRQLEDILKLFDLLCSTCRTLNTCFSLQLLYFFFINIVILVYFIYDIPLFVINHGIRWTVLIKVMILVKYSILCLMITTICQDTNNEVGIYK